ncbi:O-antigen polymerase [Rhodopseudomonas palustris BisB18]|uniref:O-antigen polymerase n=2 Tax=Rhodopseudomonas palustris TaxID=1076 RepID=Q219N3_RHOPB
MFSVATKLWNRAGQLQLVSDQAAWLVIACVPLIGVFSFRWMNIADVAVGILVVTGSILALRNPRLLLQPPLLLGLAWMLFVALSAGYATWSGSPGNQFRAWSKHIPIALGPLVAVGLIAACRQLRVPSDRLVALLLAGVLFGALVLLVRNDALGAILEARAIEATLGELNRNLATLCCGLCIIATITLVHYFLFDRRVRTRITAVAAVALIPLLIALFDLLVLLRGRGGYVATAMALTAWLFALAGPTWYRRKRDWSTQLWLAGAVIGAAAVLFGAYQAMIISGRAVVRGSLGETLRIMGQLVVGTVNSSYPPLQTAEERLQLAAVGIDLFRQRPLLGWGPDVWLLPSLYSPFPGVQGVNQFHDGYLQFLVNFGLSGALLMLALLVVLVRSALRKTPPGAEPMSPALFAGSVALLVYLLVVNVTESVLHVKCAAMIAMMLAALPCVQPSAALSSPATAAPEPKRKL